MYTIRITETSHSIISNNTETEKEVGVHLG